MTTHTSSDYALQIRSDPPPDYPTTSLADTFATTPFAPDFAARRAAFLEHVLRNPAPDNFKASFYEVARLAGGKAPHMGILHAALDYINARKDCADFVLHSILRLLYQLAPSITGDGEEVFPIDEGFLSLAQDTLLNFKYFPDEPGIDSMCTWTENHYILFTSAAYLSGQLFPDCTFPNSGQTGREKMERNRPRILRWLDLRFHTGFSEWLSHVYYDEDLTALLNLVDFCEDEEIVEKSKMVIDLLVLDMALNSFQGVFASTHGRSYDNTKKWASNEGTADTGKLLFGMGIFSGYDNMSAVLFALSRNYDLPPVLPAIAGDINRSEMINRQRMGIRMREAERWGLHFETFEDGMHFLTLEAYTHPRNIALTMRMFDAFNWWENGFFAPFKPYKWLLAIGRATRSLGLLARFLERDICRNTREEVNTYTYRTPDYMLSTAQDYRKGYGGDQQHIWQATLGPDALCFTTHPARLEGAPPNYWTGSGLLPRAAQYRNVAVVIYNLEKIPALYVPVRHWFTHAWLPKDKFDEVCEQKGWIFARKGAGYLALYSMKPYFWQDAPGEDRQREIIAEGRQNIWICEMGCKATDGDFADFIARIGAASLTFDGLNVTYPSPSQGLVRFGWEGSFSVNGAEISLLDYPRYDNPYVQVDFPPDKIIIHYKDQELSLDWQSLKRDC